MQYTSTVVDRFEAAHHIDEHSVCGGNHGHDWSIAVTVAGGLDPKEIYVVDSGELAAALRNVVDEFRGRDLNDMLPGVVTTPEGVGLYVRERLILDWPRIINVTVTMGRWHRVSIVGEAR